MAMRIGAEVLECNDQELPAFFEQIACLTQDVHGVKQRITELRDLLMGSDTSEIGSCPPKPEGNIPVARERMEGASKALYGIHRDLDALFQALR